MQVMLGLYNPNQFNTGFLCGTHCTDNLYGPRRTKTAINKCARFICCKTQQTTLAKSSERYEHQEVAMS